ncbi:hypothetical protein CIPAW_15G006700 [Carya illinoinensis]|uniref:Uncharacterized protein n=1 Tax=Carya illinoinensis TaxID=32201 RepID=A0A8T1N9W4_CARIL|nr:hypothetical protein CIPAW_15G006700 [Carya illinoinensis]
MVPPAGALPSWSFHLQIHNQPSFPTLLLNAPSPFLAALRAQSRKEGYENDVKNPLGKRTSPQVFGGQEAPHDPVLGGEMSRHDLAVGFGGAAGVGRPLLVEEAIVDGSGEVGNVDFDGIVRLWRGGLRN